MTTGEFANLVAQMWDIQKQWLSVHKIFVAQDSLGAQRESLEKKVDKALNERKKRLEQERINSQGELFGQ